MAIFVGKLLSNPAACAMEPQKMYKFDQGMSAEYLLTQSLPGRSSFDRRELDSHRDVLGSNPA